jgi:hypothetical protein
MTRHCGPQAFCAGNTGTRCYFRLLLLAYS